MVNRIDCRDCSCSEQPHGFAILPGLRNRNRIARMIHLRSPVTVHDDFINLRSWPQVRSFSEFNCRRIRIGLVEKTMPTDWTFTVRDAMRGPHYHSTIVDRADCPELRPVGFGRRTDSASVFGSGLRPGVGNECQGRTCGRSVVGQAQFNGQRG